MIDYHNTNPMVKICFVKTIEETRINERVSEIKYLVHILRMYFLIVDRYTRQLRASIRYKSFA